MSPLHSTLITAHFECRRHSGGLLCQCCLTFTETTMRTIGDRSPGRPPQFLMTQLLCCDSGSLSFMVLYVHRNRTVYQGRGNNGIGNAAAQAHLPVHSIALGLISKLSPPVLPSEMTTRRPTSLTDQPKCRRPALCPPGQPALTHPTDPA